MPKITTIPPAARPDHASSVLEPDHRLAAGDPVVLLQLVGAIRGIVTIFPSLGYFHLQEVVDGSPRLRQQVEHSGVLRTTW